MELDNNLYIMVSGIIWPLLACFELVVSIVAQNKYKHSSTGLMLAGSAIGALVTFSYPIFNLFGYYGEMVSIFYAVLNIIAIIAAVLFLIGLLNFINHLATLTGSERTMSETL